MVAILRDGRMPLTDERLMEDLADRKPLQRDRTDVAVPVGQQLEKLVQARERRGEDEPRRSAPVREAIR